MHNICIAQTTLIQDYQNLTSPLIGTFQGINFREAGFSGLYPIQGTNGKEFWTCSDRGVNIDGANANLSACRPTYDKIYAFAAYAPKIHRIRINGTTLQILQTINIKRPNGIPASGIINPTGLGSTAIEIASTDTVQNCSNFNLKTTAKDTFGIDCEGLIVDKNGNFWLCEEGGPTIWKLNSNGVLLKRYTPYANLAAIQSVDVQIDTVFKYRKNNRGFEGIAMAPNGKIYAIIQSPILYPNTATGEGTRVHRILEIDPLTNNTRMLVYLNEGVIGSGGSNQIRLKDWKIGDMAAVNDSTFLVLEAAARGNSDIKKMYLININGATAVHSGLYNGVSLEALIDSAGLSNNNITPVKKTLFMDLLANNWPSVLDKAEGLAIINDSTIAICNDNDFGSSSPNQDGVATSTNVVSHLLTYSLSGAKKLLNYKFLAPTLSQGQTGLSTTQSPYLTASLQGVIINSILSSGDTTLTGYKMAGTPDGLGAFDNGNGTFTLLINHEFGNTAGVARAHGSAGAFVSKWIINKSNLSVISGSDLIQNVRLWNGTGYTNYNASNPSSLTAFNRFCSADLPPVSAFYNSLTGLGTQERIFMNGEEAGSEGRAFGHIITGANAGTTYELPALGKFSWENAVAAATQGDKTVVAGMDDATPGQVYFYIGTKTNTGTEVERAGLVNGKLFGVAVNAMATELSSGIPAANTAFTLVDLGIVRDSTGTALNTKSNNAGVTTFLRPEDGSWDPANPNDFYFATTNAFTAPSRLWKLHFNNPASPETGGTITAVLDGTEGQKMLDNITIDNYGHIILVEDVGNNAHIGKVWQYTMATDALVQIAQHDSTRFFTGGANYLTQDEEASGQIDAQVILGAGMFLLVDQAHYALPGALVEGGQLLSLYNPDSYLSNPEIDLKSNTTSITNGSAVSINTDFGGVNTGASFSKNFVITNSGPGILSVNSISFSGNNATEFSLANNFSFPLNIPANGAQIFTVQLSPLAPGNRTANIRINNNDFDENQYSFTLQGTGVCVFPTALISIAGSSSICTGDSVLLISSAGAGLTYQWKKDSINIQGAMANTFTTSIAGNYSVELSNQFTCKSASAVQVITINPLPVAPVLTKLGNNALCFGDSIIFNAGTQNGSLYQWRNNGINIAGETSNMFTTAITGNYSVQVINSFNCKISSVTEAVSVNQTPAIPVITKSGLSVLCEGQNIVFNAGPMSGLTFQWLNNGAVINGANSNTYSTTLAGNYSVRISNQFNCKKTSVQESIAVNPSPLKPLLTKNSSTTFCAGDSVILNTTNNSGITYQWYKNEDIITGATANTFNAFTSGNYVVTATNTYQCRNISTAEPVTANALPAIPVISLSGATFSSSPESFYQWYLNGVPLNSGIAPNYTATQKGIYFVIVKNDNGCMAKSNHINYTPTGIDELKNTDQLNISPNPYDHFTIVQFELTQNSDVHIEVFNLLGQPVQRLEDQSLNAGVHHYTFGAKNAGFSAGVYLIKIKIDGRIYNKRIIEN